MNNNEIEEIEVSIVEEEIIEESNSNNSDKFYEADKFIALLEELKIELRKNNYNYSPTASSLANELMNHPKEDLDNNSYIWIMFALHKTYKHENNINGNTYACMRARDILDMSLSKGKRVSALDFHELDIDKKLIDIIMNRTKFLDEAVAQIKQKVIKYGLFLSVIVLILPLIFTSFSFGLALIEEVILWSGLMLYMLPKTKRKFTQIQSKSLLRHLNEDIRDFDFIILMSNLGK